MSKIANALGIAPELRAEIALRDKALSGDMLWVCTPATVTPVPTAAAWTREVVVTLETAAGEVHTWFNKSIASGRSVGDTGGGTASIASTTLVVVDGKNVTTVSGTEATWANTETDTLTITAATILGVTVGAKTSVETFTT
jgi:hypothetical protein